MKNEFFRKIIDEVSGKSEFVYLYGMGESLLHPKFFEMANYAVNSGLSTALSTNLSFLNEERSLKLLKSGIEFITLALDGSTKETYESIRVKGEFEKNLEQAKSFLRMKTKLGAKCSVDVQFIEMDQNKSQTQPLFQNYLQKKEKSAI
jgi:Predicted Fe-S oxidoreductases